MLLSYSPRYDEDHPDYRRYVERFEALRVRLDGHAATPQFVEFADLNGGAWKTACLFGGTPTRCWTCALAPKNIDAKDAPGAHGEAAGSRLPHFGPIEEFETAIAYVDPGNKARFIHMKSGIGPRGRHFKKCIDKPETRLVVGPD